MGGSHEIQSFCFGHTAFVACVAAVGGDMIVSGGGDGTARLWRLDDGELLRRVHIYTGSHTTASARWTPILKDFSRRSSLSAQPSLSIPALGAFQRQLTPFNSTPTFARTEVPSARSSSPSRTTTTTRRSWRRCCRRRSGPGSGSWRRVARVSRGMPKGMPKGVPKGVPKASKASR
jgi:WD40 repeat protein